MGSECETRLRLDLTCGVVANPGRRGRRAGTRAFWGFSGYGAGATAGPRAPVRTGANTNIRTGDWAVAGARAGTWARAGERTRTRAVAITRTKSRVVLAVVEL